MPAIPRCCSSLSDFGETLNCMSFLRSAVCLPLGGGFDGCYSGIVAQSGASMAEIAAGLPSHFADPGRRGCQIFAPQPRWNFQLTRSPESEYVNPFSSSGEASHGSSKSIEGAGRARGLPGLHDHGLCRRRRALELRGRRGTCQMGRPRRRQQGLLARLAAIADRYRSPSSRSSRR